MPTANRAATRRSVQPLLIGASLGALVAGISTVAFAAPVLPTGGVVRSGSASIGAPGAGSLTVTQSSFKALVDWGSFSIGQGGSVRFDNGAGATLNRVTGASVSSINGLLSATGSVYLLNPNGVIVGKSGVVDVGGSFVASTLGLSDSAFLAGGDLTFTGSSTSSVVNLGHVGALGGEVVMIASTVNNAGAITAANGDVGLLAGTQVLLRDLAQGGGRFAVRLGGAGTWVTNAGAITAAAAELRANGGDVYALAGDTSGVIRATGVDAQGGRVFLTAGDTGSVTLGGTIAARGAYGAGGAIETSAGKVTIGAARIDAGPGGSWLLDPNDLMIDQTAANTIASTLDAGSNVTQQTTASGTGGSGDITVAPNVNLTWTTNAALTLSAYRNIDIGAGTKFVSSGVGGVSLYADNAATGVGTVNFGAGASIYTFNTVNIYAHPASGSYANATNYAPFVTGPGALSDYMLVDNATDLQNVQTNLSATYALNADIDASATAGLNGGQGFAPIGATPATPFVGAFEGQGHTISNLTISRSTDGVGLFGIVGRAGRIDGFTLSNVNINGRYYVGAIAGDNYGTVTDVAVSGTVNGAGGVGGLIGVSEASALVAGVSSSATVTGTLDDVGGLIGVEVSSLDVASASGSVKGRNNVGGLVGLLAGYILDFNGATVQHGVASGAVSGNNQVGGLVGNSVGVDYGDPGGGEIDNSYATGSVTGATAVGGIVGENTSYVYAVYATGAVVGNSEVGGVAGYNFNPSHSGPNIYAGYYDTVTTGVHVAYYETIGSVVVPNPGYSVGGVTDNTPYAQSSYPTLDFTPTGSWVIFEGQTRPMLRSEASNTITNAHQLQLIDLNRAGSYTLANDVDLSVTGNPSDVWNPATQFVPIAAGPTNTSPFVGSLDGQGHTISNLRIFANYAGVGLFGVVGSSGRISNLDLANVAVNGAYYTGSLIGDSYGIVSNVSVSGTVMGYGGVGGLIGVGEGGSMVTGALGSRTTPGASPSVFVYGTGGDDVGGLLGVNLGAVSDSAGADSVYGVNNVGGLVGLNVGTIANSTASAPVAGVARAIEGYEAVGGLVGANVGSVSQSSAAATVNGLTRVGGLVGVNTGSIATSFATPDPSPGAANTVGVSITGQYAAYAGGLVGFNVQGGTVTDSYATTSSSGAALIGRNYGTVTRAYATGAASAGVTSLNQGVLTDVLWDVGTTGTTIGVASDTGTSTSVLPIGGTTGGDPTQASSYPGFDFTNVWAITPGVSRPTLRAAATDQ